MIIMGVSLFSVLTSYIATQFMARRKATGPSETELLRSAVAQSFAELSRTNAAENAALREELAALRRLLAAQAAPQPGDRA
jgi:hypothetical protein